jgi:hypothetical protein
LSAEIQIHIENIIGGSGLPVLIATTIAAVAAPINHAATRGGVRFTRPGFVLFAYVVIAMLGVAGLGIIGLAYPTLLNAMPDKWAGSFLVQLAGTLLVRIPLAMPVAFLVSSLCYAFVGGWRSIAFIILGVLGAVAIYASILFLLLFISCGTGGSCI